MFHDFVFADYLCLPKRKKRVSELVLTKFEWASQSFLLIAGLKKY